MIAVILVLALFALLTIAALYAVSRTTKSRQ